VNKAIIFHSMMNFKYICISGGKGIIALNMKYMVAEQLFYGKKAWCENGMICMFMSDNKEIRFPVEANNKLKIATDIQRNRIEIICNGTGLHWAELVEDLSVTGVIEGRYGY
jgi:hypothetical protein